MEFQRLVRERTSYRGLYRQEAVPREVLQTLMEAGCAAPSGCNLQTTSFVGVDDPTLLAQIGKVMDKKNFASAPAAICILTQKLASYRGGYYYVQDYAAAIENILLAAVDQGYASCWVEGYITSSKEKQELIAGLLGVPKSYELVAFLPIGQPAEPITRVEKKPFSERIFYNRLDTNA